MNEVQFPHFIEGETEVKRWKAVAGYELGSDPQSNALSLQCATCIQTQINFKFDKPRKA